MEKQNNSVESMWDKYLRSINEDVNNTDKTYTSWYFGNDEKMAKELAELVLKGVKKATASLFILYDKDDEPVPKKGDINIITDFEGRAICVIETTKVEIKPFNKVTKEFAKCEGEGDKSLEYWRRVHIKFFKKEAHNFNEDMLVVLERFKRVY